MIDKLDSFQYSKNLEQHLKEFKVSNNLENLSEEDKIIKFVEYVDNEEIKYIANIRRNSETLVNNLNKSSLKILKQINLSLEEIEKLKESTGFIKSVFSSNYKKKIQDEEPLELKRKKISELIIKLNLIKEDIENTINPKLKNQTSGYFGSIYGCNLMF